jgi:hypothetical protein
MRSILVVVAAALALGLPVAHAQTEVDPAPASPDSWYISADYMLWWLREGHVPPLLTTGSAASGGRLGEPGTEVLYGDDHLETRHGDRFNGVQLHLGYWLDDDQTLALEAKGFILERDSTYFKAVSGGGELLARPFTDAATGLPDSYIVAGPGPNGTLTGGFVGYSRLELFGEQADLRASLLKGENGELDLLAGGRFLQMRDRLDLTAASWLLPTQATLFGLTDHYRTHDEYYGGELGLEGEIHRDGWFLRMRGDASLGGNVQQIRTSGDQTFQTPLVKIVEPYGLTVLPNNTGTFQRTVLDSVFETGLDLGYRFNNHIECHVGYSFLYWTNPIRSGDQVELTAPPGIPFKEAAFWGQGLNTGVQIRW